MNNLEQSTIDFINAQPLELKEQLLEIIEWEKEMSWSDGYATAEEQLVINQ